MCTEKNSMANSENLYIWYYLFCNGNDTTLSCLLQEFGSEVGTLVRDKKPVSVVGSDVGVMLTSVQQQAKAPATSWSQSNNATAAQSASATNRGTISARTAPPR